jgi:polar amino acid transport system ATP-binding protein
MDGTESQPLLRVRGLKKSYGPLQVLDGIDLDLPKGATYSIIGRSGSGKSTLLRCLQLLEDSTFTELRLDGQPFGYRERDGRHIKLRGRLLAQERSHVGMVFQSFNLFPHMTAIENVIEAPIHVKGLPRDQALEVAQELLAKVNLGDKENAYPAALSGGQQQRVAIARALAMNPKLLLFDEATSALDPELVSEVLNVMRDIALGGMTMLVVTHEMRFARSASDLVVFIDQGRVVEIGPPEQVFEQPEAPETELFLRSIL